MDSKVLVYDKKSDTRAEHMIENFYGAFDEGWIMVGDSDPECCFSKDNNEDIPHLFHLALIHKKRNKKVEYLDQTRFRHVVMFSRRSIGYSSEGKFIINRAIQNSDKDKPSTKEARELLEWSMNPDVKELPSILQNPKRLPYLASLSIFCQGYLAVRYDYKEPKSSPLREALSSMGIDTITDTDIFSDLTSNTVDRKKKTTNPTWWTGAFENDQEATVALQREIEQEEAISELIEQILSASGPIDDVELVAKAYLEILDIIME